MVAQSEILSPDPEAIADPFHPWRRFRSTLRRWVSPPRHVENAIPQPFLDFSGHRSSTRGRALLSYLAWPFYITNEEVAHSDYSAYGISLEIASALTRLGYVVDVIDWRDHVFEPTRNYDVFAGMTTNFARLGPHLGATTRKIYLATRAHPDLERRAVEKRLAALARRRASLKREPLSEETRERPDLALGRAVIVLGNDRTAQGYRDHGYETYTTDNPALPVPRADPARKDWGKARHHWLFMSNMGLVQKGLDVVLDAFAGLKDLHLWIAAPLQSEPDLLALYRAELFHRQNIHPLGWTNLHSPTFARLVERCAFVISPSCSEGMSGSVVNALAAGLIPLASREVGLDVEGLGRVLPDAGPATVRSAAVEMAAWPVERCREASQRALALVGTRHTFEAYGGQIEGILERILRSARPEGQ